jgi:D-glycero-D-manno-heptose 1,7-bisphosphate phosphatase
VGIDEIMMGIPAVFLDRDGTIIRAQVRDGKPFPPSRLEEVEILSGAVDSLLRLSKSGYLLIGITNQPDVARGKQSRKMVEAIHDFIQSHLPVREIFTCYHDNDDQCNCRKPKPGLILEASQKYGVDLSRSWMVGDRWRDIAAGQAAGVKTIFLDYHYSETVPFYTADYTIPDIAFLAETILKGK